MNFADAIERIAPEVIKNLESRNIDYREIAGASQYSGPAVALVASSPWASSLENIAYIFNSQEPGCFGIYKPALDHSVKVGVVGQKMREEGYETTLVNNRLYARKPWESAEQAKNRMEEIFNTLKMKGGVIFGVDVAKDEATAVKDYNDMIAAGAELDDSDLAMMSTIKIASTMVHEAVHAKGMGEDDAKTQERAFTQWALDQMNQQRGEKTPLMIGETEHVGLASDWFKAAQIETPFGWTLIEPILRMNQGLDEQFFRNEKGPHDSLEKQLETNQHHQEDTDKIVDRKLEKDRDDERGLHPIEQQLEDDRVQPLMIPVKKTAGINSNNGGPFISSPFAIDEYLERVWSWDKDFGDLVDYDSGEDPWWRTRYKPENKRLVRGKDGRWTYQYTERLRIRSFDSANIAPTWNMLMNDNTLSSPWFRAAGELTSEERGEFINALKRIGYHKVVVKSGKRDVARFVIDRDVADMMMEAFSDVDNVSFDDQGEKIVWIFNSAVDGSSIEKMEEEVRSQQISDETIGKLGVKEDIKEKINLIINACREITSLYGLKSVYLVGGFPRVMASSRDYLDVADLDFTSAFPDECLKLGGLLASRMGVKDVAMNSRTMTMNFDCEGVSLDFRGSLVSRASRDMLRQNGLKTTPLNFDVYGRDFTVNSLIYDFMKNKIYDVTGQGLDDLSQRLVRTIFDPEDVIPSNPLVITRAILLNLRGFEIETHLAEVMEEMGDSLFSGVLSDERLGYEYKKIAGYGDEGLELLKEYGIEKLEEVYERVRCSRPELFEEV